MIDEIKKYLSYNYFGEGYRIKEFSNNIYFGKDENNNFIFARINTSNENKFNISTKVITMYQNTSFKFTTDDGNVVEDNYDVLVLDNYYKETLNTFINLCLNFYSSQEDKSILELTEDLIELYKIVGSGNYESQQGFWAEMFTIIHIYNTYNINIGKFWHSDPYNKYDFSLSDNVKIEVKSTIKEYREHAFSHEQVYTKNKVYISSVMMQQDDQGQTIQDLFDKVKEIINDDYNVLKMLEQEMSKYLKTSYLKFNYKYSEDNIKIYINNNVPKFEQEEPDGVHGTTYTIQLEGVQALENNDIQEIESYINNK